MIFDKGFTEKLKLDMAERLSPKRYKHTLGVAAAAVKLAHIYGLDEEKAEVADYCMMRKRKPVLKRCSLLPIPCTPILWIRKLWSRQISCTVMRRPHMPY